MLQTCSVAGLRPVARVTLPTGQPPDLLTLARFARDGTVDGVLLWSLFSGQVDLGFCDLLYDQVAAVCKEVGIDTGLFYFRHGVFPTSLLREHPCNAHVCGGKHCHGGKSNLPRRLTVLPDGRILPGSAAMAASFEIGRVLDGPLSQVLCRYNNSQRHRRFLAACRVAYEGLVLNSPYVFTPWQDLLAEQSRRTED